VAAEFQGSPAAIFLSANCDEDETLVAPYLQQDKPHTQVVFADGLDRLFSINSFPTVIVIDREGKIAFRSDGFDPDSFARELSAAVHRALEGTTSSSVSLSPSN
jgi:TolB-like protein